MFDPIPQGLKISDRETAIKRLKLLQRNILRLRDEIPDMANMTSQIRECLSGMDEDTKTLLFLVDRLLERQRTWQEWLAGRLTLLANLKIYLEMKNNNELLWGDGEEEEEGA